MRRLLAAALTLPLLVAPAAGEGPSAHARVGSDAVVLERDPGSVVSAAEVGLGPGTTRLATDRYAMVGATWQGSAPAIAVRTAPGEPWLGLPELADGPTVGGEEGVPGLGATDLVWVGPDQDLEVRVGGTGFRDLDLVLIEPGKLPADADAPAARRTTGGAAAPDRAPRPELRSRKSWDADPSWRNGRPRYNDRLKQVHVHHTASGNNYSRTDVPGILRGIYRYHTHDLGWFDIGYNFLVDRFGRGWVGRSGGAARLVRGAHTLGFNHTSVGVAVIGNLESRRPWKPAVGMLARVAAWKLDKHGRDAVGKVRVRSTGSDKYAEGERPRLPVIDGHRDTNDTACPGQKLYDRLPRVRHRAQARIDRFDP